jgi:hypothetical protein
VFAGKRLIIAQNDIGSRVRWAKFGLFPRNIDLARLYFDQKNHISAIVENHNASIAFNTTSGGIRLYGYKIDQEFDMISAVA